MNEAATARQRRQKNFFSLDGYPKILWGNAVIWNDRDFLNDLKPTPPTDPTPPTATLDELRRNVKFFEFYSKNLSFREFDWSDNAKCFQWTMDMGHVAYDLLPLHVEKMKLLRPRSGSR
jgi:hypothetical protein